MANVVVVGAQWGDEGKGKIVDWLSERADVIARFQGGHNAGHTLVIDGEVFKLSILPSGIVRSGKLSVIGNGVVLDPWHLITEIDQLRAQGVTITPETLMIAENTTLILPVHGELDRAREAQNSVAKIGTTGRGVGPAYEDKVGRRAIRVADLADDATLQVRVDRALCVDARRAGVADAAQVIAHQVGDHRRLGAVLGALVQRAAARGIGSRPGALHRACPDAPGLSDLRGRHGQEPFGAQAEQLCPAR